MSKFNEATRVQMPAMVHLTRLGYKYFGKIHEATEGKVYDGETNILLEVFKSQFEKLNPGHEGEYLQVLRDIRKELNDDDLGRGFYKRLKAVSPIRLIDFDDPKNNTFHFTAEFTCKNGQDEFRPDITLFVNGLPLCFVEVKKPNNHGGMVAESTRMNKERFPNKKFRRFINTRWDSGTGVPSMTASTLYSISMLQPDNGLLKRFDETIIPMFQRIKQIKAECEELTKQRDELLPLLMNGQVSLNSNLVKS